MNLHFQKTQTKIQNWKTAQQTIQAWKDAGLEIVFTNGCFDLLHFGHIHYLAQAADLGDKLVIGLNASESVSRLKGAHRPIKDDRNRSAILASLQFVDLVVIFEQDTPLELIETLRPDILVKGGDWSPEQIVGNEIVLDGGGKVLSLDFVDGYSTSSLENKIKQTAKSDI